MLTGILPPSGGTARVAGHEVTRGGREIRPLLGYMSQKFSLYDELTAAENLDYFAGIYGVAPVERRARKTWALEVAGLAGRESMRTGDLSGGWKQRLALAAAILHRIWYNPGLRFVYFVVISMIALAAYMVGVIHPAATIVREKESGTIEQVLVSPLRPGELILAKTLPTLIIGLLALGPALLIARAFGVPFRGDLATFAVLSAVFLVSAIATGVLIATWTRTLQQALLVAFFILFPILFLSGTMTPIESMPDSLQLLSRLSPLRHYMEAMLSVFLKGVGLGILWPHLLWMAGLGAVLLGASVIFFRRRLMYG